MVLGVVGIMGPLTVTVMGMVMGLVRVLGTDTGMVMGMGLGTVVATVLGTMKAGAMIEAPLT